MRSRRIEIYPVGLPPESVFIRQEIRNTGMGCQWITKRIDPEGMLSSTETAPYLKVSLRRIYQLIETCKLEAIRTGPWLSIRLRDLTEFAKIRRKPGRPRKGTLQPSDTRVTLDSSL